TNDSPTWNLDADADTDSDSDSDTDSDTDADADTDTDSDTDSDTDTPHCWKGDFHVTDPISMAKLGSYNCVWGNLFVEDSDLTSLAGLDAITDVGQSLTIAR